MDTYRRFWLVVTAATGVVGVLCALTSLGHTEVLALAIIGALMASATAAATSPSAWPRPSARRFWAKAVVLTGVGTVVFGGCVAAFGLSGAELVLFVLAASPPLVRWGRRKLGALPGGLDVRPGPVDPHVGLAKEQRDAAALTNEALSRAWRASYRLVERARDPEYVARLADLRRRYLDELERRDPGGFRRWLESGARAGSDPGRFIALDPPD